jgi:hypothetical protein
VPWRRRHLAAYQKRLLGVMYVAGWPPHERGNKKEFAERVLGISQARWNNIITGVSPLSREVAGIIKKRFPAISMDWLQYGDGQPVPGDELASAKMQAFIDGLV